MTPYTYGDFKVWFDFGGASREDVQLYAFKTAAELNAFLEGIAACSAAWGIDDFRQFDTEAEMEAAFEEEP